MAKNKFEWKREYIDGRWYSVCLVDHVPMIKHNPDGTYTVKDRNGRPRIEKELKNAIKFALEVYEKFIKFNKRFVA